MPADASLLGTAGLVLVALSRHGAGITLREIGDAVGITERSAFRTVSQLEQAGYLVSRKVGRRNVYELQLDAPLRHPLLEDLTLSDLLGAVFARGDDRADDAREAGDGPVVDLRDGAAPERDDALRTGA